MAKKYFWLKLKEDFFRDKRIKKLRRIAGGDTFTVIYLKLQLLSLKNNGALIFEGIEDNLAEELALDIDEDEDNVKVTLAFLQQNGLIEETEEDHYIMTETIKCIGSESDSKERVRRHRERKALQLAENEIKSVTCNAQVTTCNIEIEKEKEKELEIYKPIVEAEASTVLTTEEILFNEFWASYPKKVNKKGCFTSYKRIKGLKDQHQLIMAALDNFKKSKQWTKDNGQFIPNPQTFINQRRWETVIENNERQTVLDKLDMGGWV